ncbi:isochorismate synthase [Aggregicoccus sp. 17bor-14]|uniref:isochorismate synthase n=1 Tax=Myxococcaceae TaxID=31 RepID=UPI00129C3B8C|nr:MULTISPECIES: isochorismate synthase [Myxococcaceae]MBF5043962.1 isochorismate synthase [Simulacricoccus sp. 17bor-14]MRI89713.1 isochorismate synthase [Aggregicoccus sp. 17bor-14]
MTTHTPLDGRRYVAGTLSLPAVDPLAGADVLGLPSVYWERPLAQEAAAGWGEAAAVGADDAAGALRVLEALASDGAVRWLGGAAEAMPGPWFGGMRFAASQGPDYAGGALGWDSFGHGRWVLPELLVWRVEGGLRAAAFAPEDAGGEDRVRSRLERVRNAFPERYRHAREGAQHLQLRSSREGFEARVSRALEAIGSGALQKVVMARAIDAQAEQPFSLVDVLARLREQNPRCATFLLRAPGGTAFVGATPETLCRMEGARLSTEALAGSASPAQAGALAGSDKDLREHRSVVDGIREALAPLSSAVHADEAPALLALKNVVHLRTGIEAELKEGVGPAALVSALHPTPAVGGSPRERALHFLREHEALDRGWYAGPVGWVGPGRAHLVVALRSALVEGARARLFVGAGIVRGSDPAAEWRETEIKGVAMRRALGEANV